MAGAADDAECEPLPRWLRDEIAEEEAGWKAAQKKQRRRRGRGGSGGGKAAPIKEAADEGQDVAAAGRDTAAGAGAAADANGNELQQYSRSAPAGSGMMSLESKRYLTAFAKACNVSGGCTDLPPLRSCGCTAVLNQSHVAYTVLTRHTA